MRGLALLSALIVLLVSHAVALAGGKVALVIGNGAYQNANPLPNPTNDASDMAAELGSLGFKVISGNDLDHSGMAAKIGDFEEASRDADVTLFFYAGHGLQVGGRNYLVPVNAKLDRESSLQFEAIDADIVFRSMSGPGKTAIALLDACRDNPLSRSLARSMGKTRSTVVQQGLAAPNITGGGLLIGFATAPGDVAADGEGRNSPFTTALLKNLKTPGLEVQQLMTRVKADVFSSTKETQEPWHNSSLRSEVYLNGDAQPKQDVAKTDNPAVSSAAAEWELVKNTTSIAVLDAFIASHANSPLFVALAEDRKQTLRTNDGTAIPDSLVVEKKPEQRATEQAMLDEQKNPDEPQQPKTTGRFSFDNALELAVSANAGQTVAALLGPPVVDIPMPAKNAGPKTPKLGLRQIETAASLDALRANVSDVQFSDEATTNCRLDWLDRCQFLPGQLVNNLRDALAAKGLDINNHDGNYFNIKRIAGRDEYLFSNNPSFGKGDVAIIAAIISPDLSVQSLFGFDLSAKKLGVDPGDPASDVTITWAAVVGDDLLLSFDSSYRCTDKPRKFGFITRFSISDRNVKWVSPFNVSDANFIVRPDTGTLVSGNGGSCVDDFIYQINAESGDVQGRAKLPSAVSRMDYSNGFYTLELYDSAGTYQID